MARIERQARGDFGKEGLADCAVRAAVDFFIGDQRRIVPDRIEVAAP